MTEEKQESHKLRFRDENGEDYPSWEEKKLGEVAESKTTRTTEEIPYVSVEDLKQDFMGLKDELKINSKSAIYVSSQSTIIGNIRPYLRKTAFLDQNIKVDSDVIPLSVIDNTENCPIFLYASIASEHFFYVFQKNVKGTKMPRGDKKFLINYSFPFPSLPEQQKIGEFFAKLDTRIEQQQKLIELLKLQKKGYAQQIFGGKLRFKDENGADYPDWEEKRFEEIINAYQPKTVSKKDFVSSDGYPVYGAGGKIGLYDKYNHLLSEVVIGCRGNVGSVNLTMPKSWINGNAMVLSPINENILSKDFLYQLALWLKLERVSDGSAQPQITRKPLLNIKCNIPSLEEQQKIGAFLSSLDKEIELAEAKLEQFKKEKKAYSQRMLG